LSIIAAAVTCGLLFVTPSAHAEGVSVPDGSICVVYDQPVTRDAFDQLIASARIQYRDNDRPFPPPGTADRRILEADAVDYLVTQGLLRTAAAQRSLTVAEDDVDVARSELIASIGGIVKYRAELERVGMTDERVREDLRFDLLSKRLFEAVVADAPSPSDEQVRAEYDQNRAAYRTPRSRLVAHILVRTKARAQSIRRLLQGEPFSAFQRAARRHSLDPSTARAGGRLDIQMGQTVRPFERVTFALKTGQLSAPVRTTFGWHLIYGVGDVRPARQKPFSEVRQEIRRKLVAQAESDHYQEWSDAWRLESTAHVGCVAEHPWTAAATSADRSNA
jgi:parvulin-like peptidyl-prolyl isomerase